MSLNRIACIFFISLLLINVDLVQAKVIVAARPQAVASPVTTWLNEYVQTSTLDGYNYTATIYQVPQVYNTSTGYQLIDRTIKSKFYENFTYAVETGIYKAYFSSDFNAAWNVLLVLGDGTEIRFKHDGFVYYDYLNGLSRSLSTPRAGLPTLDGNSITYLGAYAGNVAVRYEYRNGGLKEFITIPNATVRALPDPSVYGMNPATTLLASRITWSVSGLEAYQGNSSLRTIDSAVSESPITLRDYAGKVKMFFPVDFAWDSQVDGMLGLHNNSIPVKKRLVHNGPVEYLYYGLPYSWVKSSKGAVTIDPTSTIQPANGDDTYIRDQAKTSNYGASADMYVGDIHNDLTGNYTRDLLKITDFSSIPAGVTIINASVGLYVASGGKAGVAADSYNIIFRRLLPNWVEAQATWNVYSTGNSWNTAGAGGSGTDIDADTSASRSVAYNVAAGFQEFSGAVMIDDVRAWYNGTYANNYGWRINTDGEGQPNGSYWYLLFDSSDAGGAGTDPYLKITYTTYSYLTTYKHTGIATFYVNGTAKANGTETSFASGEVANLTSAMSAGYQFDNYTFANGTLLSSSNPDYLTMNQNYTIHAWANATTTTTTAAGGSAFGGTAFIVMAVVVSFAFILVVMSRKRG